ncbi:MAG: hypothetical protein ACFCVC_13895 [Acidimicrobiia bacterium]
MTIAEHAWPPFAPIRRPDGYTPIEDHEGTVGDVDGRLTPGRVIAVEDNSVAICRV